MFTTETLPLPEKLRAGAAKEDAKLSDFQQELVQMAAVLKGDHHKKDLYPNKLVKNMTVAEGARYVEDAFKTFWDEFEKAMERGVDESEILVLPKPKSSKSFRRKIRSCLACNN